MRRGIVLLIDDRPSEQLRMSLYSRGFQMIQAKDLEVAKDFLKKFKMSFVLASTEYKADDLPNLVLFSHKKEFGILPSPITVLDIDDIARRFGV